MNGFLEWIISSLIKKEELSEEKIFSEMKRIYYSHSPREIIKRLEGVGSDLFQECVNLLVLADKSELEHITLFKGYLSDDREEIRLAALEGLMFCPHPQGREIVLDLVCNPEETLLIRSIALNELGKFFVFADRKTALQKLLALAEDPSGEIRRGLIRALAIIGGDEGIATLKKLAADTEGRIRQMAIRILKRKDRARVLETIEQALEDPEPAVRAESLRAFAECSYFSPVKVLQEMMQDPSSLVREAANLALSKYPEEYERALKGLEKREHLLTAEKVKEALQSRWFPRGWLERTGAERIELAHNLLAEVRKNRSIIEDWDLEAIHRALPTEDKELLEVLVRILFYCGNYRSESFLGELLKREDLNIEITGYARAALNRWTTPHCTPASQKVVILVSDDLDLIETLQEVCAKNGVYLRHARPLTPDIMVFSGSIKIIDRRTLGRENWDLFCEYLQSVNGEEMNFPEEELGDETPLLISDNAGPGEFRELENALGPVYYIPGQARELIGRRVEKATIHSEQTSGGFFAGKREIERWEDED